MAKMTDTGKTKEQLIEELQELRRQVVKLQERDITERKYAEAEHERMLAALEHRSTQLQTAAEVARAASSILDPDVLIPQVVDLVRERFGLYYAGLFLVDWTGEWARDRNGRPEPGKWAVLRAGTGEAGQQMLEQGHKLEVGGTSMIGQCVANRQAGIALDVGEEAMRFENPLLPETRSELALPIISRGRAIGALTIQSTQEAAFSKADIAALQTMADQLANAISTARLYKETEELRAFNENIVQSMEEGILIEDATGHITFVNPRTTELLGQAPEELIGQHWTAIVDPEHLAQAEREATKRSQNVTSQYETILLTREGRRIPVIVSARPLFEEDQFTGVLAVFTDITEHKRAEEALQKAHEELEQYTSRLERQAAQLQVAAEVAREATAILDVHQLLDTVVRLISERFGFYHAGVFLVDEQGEYAILRAASSEGGHRMLERGHRLRVGKVGIVGHVAATGEPRIALDVGADAVFFNNPYLPDTRSEMGLPLKIRGLTIGVLDVQSTQEAAFSEDDVAVLQTLGDQLAVTIENAHLVAHTEAQLRELSLLHGEYSAAAWAKLASPEHSLGYVYDRIDVVPAEQLPAPLAEMAVKRGETVALVEPDGAEKVLATPLKFRDQIIGTLGIQEADGGQQWSPNEIALVEAVSEQVGLALENARLFAEAQKSAQQMQALYETSRVLSSSLEERALMRAVLEAIYRALDCEYALISIVDEGARTIDTRHGIWHGELDAFPEWMQMAQYPLDHPDILADIYRTGNTEIIGEWDERFNREIWDQFGPQRFQRIFMPIKMRDRVIGVIEAGYDKQGRFQEGQVGEDEVQMLAAFTDQAAVALENARLFEEARRRLQEQTMLFTASQSLASTLLQPEEIAEIVVRQFVEVMRVPECSLSVVDPQTGTLRVLADLYISEEGNDIYREQEGLVFSLADYPATARVMETLQPLIVQASDPNADPAELAYMQRHGVVTMVIIPLAAKGRPIGVIELETWDQEHEYTQEQLNLAMTLANQAAVALENAHLFEEAQRRATQLAAAAEVARDATAILDVDQLLDETVHLISEQFDFYHAGVFLLDEQEVYAVLRAASSEGGRRMLEKGHKLRAGKVGLVGYVAGTGEPRISLDVGTDAEHFAHSDLPDTRSEMALPLKVRDRVIGVLDVQSTQEGAFSEEDVTTLQTLADQLAAAIVNARLFQEVRTDAMRRALINEVQQAAATSLDPDELLHQAGEVISHRLQRSSALFIWEPEEENLRLVAAHNAEGTDIPLVDSLRVTRRVNPTLFSEVIDRRRISILDTREPDFDSPAATPAKQLGIYTGVYVPLTIHDQVLGMLVVAQAEDHPSEGLDFVEIIGANLSVALDNARLYQDAVETTEKLEEMDRLKSQFLANMSHELRTPLNSIIGFSRVILKGIDGPLTDMQRTDLQAIYDSGQHLLGLINDILDISKIQAGKMELSLEDVDLHKVIKGVMSTAIALVKDKPVKLQQALPPDLPTIRGDIRRIRQMIINMVGNAAKFTEQGFIHVEAKASPTEVLISVADSGIGIPEEELGTIFEEFTQVDGSSTRRAGGTGLGLSITRHFAEMHGGRIWAESTSDVGSTFHIALPIEGPPEPSEESEEERTAGVLTEQPGPEQEPGQKIVLCVDDDEGVIMLFRRYLSKRGYRVVGLTNSTAVMEIARQLEPFAITLDVMMPGKDGWQVVQELKTDPETRHIPVIMCTIVSEKEHGLSLGASDYLIKPILEDDLVAALERLDRGADHHLVLVVDDQPEDRSLLCRMIESQEGYEVIEAAGGQEAITQIRQIQPDIITLDLMMPEVDGFAVLEAVRSDKATRSIPIIIVTAKDLTQEERGILTRRVEALLQKGLFEQRELLADVATALERIRTGQK